MLLYNIFKPVGTVPVITSENRSVPVPASLDSDLCLTSIYYNDSIGLGIWSATPPAFLSQTAFRVLSGGSLISWPSPCGSNCSYSVSFSGPIYECTQTQQLLTPPISLNVSGQIETYGVRPDPVVFVFADEVVSGPVGLWLAYTPNPVSESDPSVLNFTIIHCGLHNATYVLDISYVNNIQFVEKTILTHQSVNSDAIQPGHSGQLDWGPNNLFGIHESIARILAGTVSLEGPSLTFNGTNVQLWNGFANTSISNPSGFPILSFELLGNVSAGLIDLLANVTISLLHQQDPVPCVMSASASVNLVASTLTNATMTNVVTIYKYASTKLWAIYGVGIGLGLFCLLFDLDTMRKTEIPRALSFSQIVVSTRNQTLDATCVGDEILAKQVLSKKKLRFDKIENEDKAAFTVVGI